MRLFICLLVLLLSGASGEDQCFIDDIKDNSSVDMDASAQVDGLEAVLINKVEVAANNPEEFGDLCAEQCCQNDQCNIAEVSFEAEEDTCQLIRCFPVDKCVWQENPDTISIILGREFTSPGSPSSSVATAAATTPIPSNTTTASSTTPSNTTSPVAASSTPKPENASSALESGMSSTPANQNTTDMTSPSANATVVPPSPQPGSNTTATMPSNSTVLTNSTTQQAVPINSTTTQQAVPINSTTTQQAAPINSTTTTQNNSTTQSTVPQSTTAAVNTTAISANSTTSTTINNQTAPIQRSSTTEISNTTTTTTMAVPVPTTTLVTNTTGPFNATAAPVNDPDDDKLSPYSLAAIFGTSITVSLLVVFIVSHRFYESWKRRHYKQINA